MTFVEQYSFDCFILFESILTSHAYLWSLLPLAVFSHVKAHSLSLSFQIVESPLLGEEYSGIYIYINHIQFYSILFYSIWNRVAFFGFLKVVLFLKYEKQKKVEINLFPTLYPLPSTSGSYTLSFVSSFVSSFLSLPFPFPSFSS